VPPVALALITGKFRPARAQFLCEQHRVGFVWRESETLGETVTQDEDRFRWAGVAGGNGKD
jgi:hypothetical protein